MTEPTDNQVREPLPSTCEGTADIPGPSSEDQDDTTSEGTSSSEDRTR